MCRAAATATDAHFNPRTPRGGATHTCEYIKDFFAHFNPRTPRGGATINSSGKRRTYARFQSTHPARGCDFLKNFSDFHAQISIHAPREGVRRVPENVIILPLRISIHAPREGVRRGRHKCKRVIFHFNPRTPRGGATWPAQMQARDFPFQSTHPARGCDLSCCSICGLCVISIHAPREGVRRQNKIILLQIVYFNPRTPRGGATFAAYVGGMRRRYFNPRTPRGGATLVRGTTSIDSGISIHAPREGVRLTLTASW